MRTDCFFSKKVFGQFLLLTSAKARHDFAHLRTVELMLIHDPIIGMPSSVPDKQFTFAPETNQFLHADYVLQSSMCLGCVCVACFIDWKWAFSYRLSELHIPIYILGETKMGGKPCAMQSLLAPTQVHKMRECKKAQYVLYI